MKVLVEGAPVTLGKGDYLASGGEGEIYVKGQTAYKLYHDPKKMIPLGKIQELQAIRTPAVIRPLHVIQGNNRPVGYTMAFVPDAWTLCQMFTRTFRDREGLTPSTMAVLVQQLRDAVASVHAAHVLVVDLNEMNAVVTRDFAKLYLLDADSYQTPHYPATALMESVRDRHAKGFTVGTDWFAYAVTTFQMFVGIHPYKGKHPGLTTLDSRMQANVSVLNAEVATPRACYPFSVIPPVYLDWYRATFERGLREPPPVAFTAAAQVPVQTSATPVAHAVTFTTIGAYGGSLRDTVSSYGRRSVVSSNGMWVDGRTGTITGHLAVDTTGNFCAVVLRDKVIHAAAFPHGALAGQMPVDSATMISFDGRVYVQVRDRVCHLILQITPTSLLLSLQPVLTCMEHATRLYHGCAVQNMLGEPYVSLLRPEGVYTVRVPELKGYQVLHARVEGTALVVVAAKNGTQHRFVFRFDPSFSVYDVRLVPDIPAYAPNFTVTDTGVVVMLNENTDIEVFHAARGAQGLRVIQDAALDASMRLVALDGRVGCLYGSTLYSMRM